MSLLLRPEIAAEDVPVISLIACLAVARTIKSLTGLYAETKWPNDVLIHSKKVCGILPESVLTGNRVDYLVLGFGINVNQGNFPEELKERATSIRMEFGASFPKEHILEKVIAEFGDLYDEMQEYGTEGIIESWKDLCSMMDKDVVIQEGKVRFRGIMRGVNPKGYLILETYDGVMVNIYAGEATCVG